MFKKAKPNDITSTQDLIDSANSQLLGLDAETEEYNRTLDQIERLHKLSSREKDGRRVSPDTLLIVAGNLAGIVLILNYEKLGIVTSKALGFVMKAK